MQNPHLRAGEMFPSSSMSALSRSESIKAAFVLRAKMGDSAGAAEIWWGTAGLKKAAAKVAVTARMARRREAVRFIITGTRGC